MDDFDLYGDDEPAPISQLPAVQNKKTVKDETVQLQDDNDQDNYYRSIYNDPKQDNAQTQDNDTLTDIPGSRGLIIHDLTWYTTDEELKEIAEEAGVGLDAIKTSDITFLEQKINGKSKGTAYMEFKTHRAALLVKQLMEKIEIHERKPRAEFTVEGAPNPFRTVPKDPKEIRAEQAAMAGIRPPVAGTGPIRSGYQGVPPPYQFQPYRRGGYRRY